MPVLMFLTLEIYLNSKENPGKIEPLIIRSDFN